MESRVPTWMTFCPGTRLRRPKRGDDRVGLAVRGELSMRRKKI